eukprot:9060719-Alexandrium_andersonii.AAC.1
MSASLVGSEMCIRDSAFCGPTNPCISQPCTFAVRGAPRRGAHEGRAVSYTHLTLPTICSV